jgi:hypothetical protein
MILRVIAPLDVFAISKWITGHYAKRLKSLACAPLCVVPVD